MFFRTVIENVGAGMNTLMSISDVLGLSIFYRKMEKACPMGEEKYEEVVYFPPESVFYLRCYTFRLYVSLFVP